MVRLHEKTEIEFIGLMNGLVAALEECICIICKGNYGVPEDCGTKLIQALDMSFLFRNSRVDFHNW